MSEQQPDAPIVDTELKQLNICDQLRANSSFMKIMATLFHYGNQSMNAAQLVTAVRALDLLALRGETPKSTIQGIISTSRKAARDYREPDPFQIDKDNSGRQAKYSISQVVLNGAELPAQQEVPDRPIELKPVHTNSSYTSYAAALGKRQRKTPKFFTPDALRKANRRRARSKLKRRQNPNYSGGESDDNLSDVDVDDEDMDMMSVDSDEEADNTREQLEEDTISSFSLLYSAPTPKMDYIDAVNFDEYPIAKYFAVAQQTGYSYPRFRSQERVKIPKPHCEDKFRVADIKSQSRSNVVGRLFILADGHGGRGCSEFFVRNTPAAIQNMCDTYEIKDLDDKDVQKRFEGDIKRIVEMLDSEYLEKKRIQIRRTNGAKRQKTDNQNGDHKDTMETNETSETNATEHDEESDNDGCTLIINLFFGNWLINVNVGDSRSVLISAPEPPAPPKLDGMDPSQYASLCGAEEYRMDVAFASQDHKPYLEHLAKEILENGGEFVDSVQDRVIKVDLEKLREDGNRQAKRTALKNARIRPKGYTPDESRPNSHHNGRMRSRDAHVPSLNVARSCGDLDFKMDPNKKIISCEPDVTFVRVSDGKADKDALTILTSGPNQHRRRHFLLMGTDGLFDYMYEETAERQNRALAKILGPMVEEGEKFGRLVLDEEERAGGETIEHNPDTPKDTNQDAKNSKDSSDNKHSKSPAPETEQKNENKSNEQEETKEMEAKEGETKAREEKARDEPEQEPSTTETKEEKAPVADDNGGVTQTDGETKTKTEAGEESKMEEKKDEEAKIEEEPAPVPLLFRELDEEESKSRKVKERTLVAAARYFANRESVNGFFSSTLQDYDDCTIVLIEI